MNSAAILAANSQGYAWRALRKAPLCRPLWRLLLIAGLGRHGTLVRRALRNS